VKRQIIRVEPLSTYLERWNAPISAVTRHGDTIYAAVNAIYARYFPKDPPARVFVNVQAWPGHFDIEIDCVAVL
jgi:enamine deaminase RidA (YjgF/YER057c/UK114 family)